MVGAVLRLLSDFELPLQYIELRIGTLKKTIAQIENYLEAANQVYSSR